MTAPPTKQLSLTEQIKVWRATGMPVTLTPERITQMDNDLTAVVENCRRVLDQAIRERRRARSWALWQTAWGLSFVVGLMIAGQFA